MEAAAAEVSLITADNPWWNNWITDSLCLIHPYTETVLHVPQCVNREPSVRAVPRSVTVRTAPPVIMWPEGASAPRGRPGPDVTSVMLSVFITSSAEHVIQVDTVSNLNHTVLHYFKFLSNFESLERHQTVMTLRVGLSQSRNFSWGLIAMQIIVINNLMVFFWPFYVTYIIYTVCILNTFFIFSVKIHNI